MSRRTAQIRSTQAHLLLAGASAVLLALCYPAPGWGVLAHVALIPATILALRSVSAKRLFWISWLVATLWWLWMLRWLTPVTGAGYAVLSAFLAVYWSASLLGVRQLVRRYDLPCTLALALAWTSLELVRGCFVAGGFNWFGLSHALAAYSDENLLWHSRLIQSADLFGEHTVSFLVAMTNGLVVDVLTRPWVRVRSKSSVTPGSGQRPAGVCLLIWAVFFISAWSYGQFRIMQFDAATRLGPTMAVAQTNIVQNNKEHPTAQQMQHDWRRALALVQLAAEKNPRPDLIVLPETTPPFAINPDAVNASIQRGWLAHRYHEEIVETVRQVGAPLLIGASAKIGLYEKTVDGSPVLDSAQSYNSVYLYHADGRQDDKRYDKMHLVPFGEYLPWVEWFSGLKRSFIRWLTPYDQDYTLDRGQTPVRFEISYGAVDAAEKEKSVIRIAAPICFEDAVPRVCRRLIYDSGEKQADVLMNLTNDGWFAGSYQPAQHLQIASLRCIENRTPMVRCVNTGVSAYVDSLGRVAKVVRGQAGDLTPVEGVASQSIRLDSRSTLFGRWGHAPMAIMAAAMGILLLAGVFRREKEQ